jgi:hypothetical protein
LRNNESNTHPAYDVAFDCSPTELSKNSLIGSPEATPDAPTIMHDEMVAIIERMRAAARELELMAAADESHRKREYERLAARMRHLADDAESALISGVSLRLW